MSTEIVERTMYLLPILVPPIVLLAVFGGMIARRRALVERLQRIWGWLGPARTWQGGGRAWSGVVDGRRVDVRWFEHNTTVEVGARPEAEVAFTRKGQPPELASPGDEAAAVELLGKVGYAADATVVRALADRPEVDEALGTLLGEPDTSLRAVRVDPKGTVSWFARYLPERRLTREDAQEWVRALLVVARASEA
jgi:hypothetical protein